MTAGVASAETAKPRNILEFLFGQRKTEEPTSIAPPQATLTQPARSKAAPVQAKQKQDKRLDTKAEAKRTKPSIRRMANQSIDPDPSHQPAAGSYRGPFRGAGNTAFCVRTCDGYFFPINHEGAQGADRYDTACQTSCPGAKTEVYFMKRGGDIKWSATARGEGYMRLENALKYRKERDPACTCKSQEQNWSSILAPVETMMKHAKTDVLVTEETSNEIARGEDPATLGKKAEQQKAEQQKASQQKAEQQPVSQPLAGKRADIGAETRASHLRSSFGERIAPSNRFIKIDPDTTGSLPSLPAQSTLRLTRDTKSTLQKLPARPGTKSANKAQDPAGARPKADGKAKVETTANATGKARADARAKPESQPKAAPKAEPKSAKAKPVTQVAEAPKPLPQPAPTQDRSSLRQTLERLFSTDKR